MDGLALHEVNISVSSSSKLAGHSRDDYADSSIVPASAQKAEWEPRPTPYPLLTCYFFFFFLLNIRKYEELHLEQADQFYPLAYYDDYS